MLIKNLSFIKAIVKKDDVLLKESLDITKTEFTNILLLLKRHNLGGLVYSALKDRPIYCDFPDDFQGYLRDSYKLQWVRNEFLLKRLSLLNEEFLLIGKEIIFLKGPLFAEQYYGDLGVRSVGDIDFLIKREDLRAADEGLIRYGYSKSSNILFSKAIMASFVHHFEYVKENVAIELHWALTSHFSYNVNYVRVWEQKRVLSYRESSFYVLSDEYAFLFMILSAFMDIQLGRLTLKSAVDIYTLLKKIYPDMDWWEFMDERRREKTFAITLNILDMVFTFLDCHDDFEGISEYLRRDQKRIKTTSLDEKLQFFRPTRFAVKNKLWAFGIYESNPLSVFLWWAMSLPFRISMRGAMLL